jgi:hypothetical protein
LRTGVESFIDCDESIEDVSGFDAEKSFDNDGFYAREEIFDVDGLTCAIMFNAGTVTATGIYWDENGLISASKGCCVFGRRKGFRCR